MSEYITTPIKKSRYQRTGNIPPYDGHRGILKPRSDSSTRSSSIKILEALPPITDPYLYLYD